MPINKKSYKDRKLAAAQRAISAARSTVATARGRYSGPTPRAPLAIRGFYGSYSRRGRAELKVVENAPTAISPVTTGGTIVCYNLIAQGTDFTNRVGRQVCLKSCLLRLLCSPTNSAPDSQGDVVRCMLIYDDQPNSSATVPNVTDVLTTADIFSGVNLNNRDRFKVLYDKRFQMYANAYTAGSLTAGAPQQMFKEKFIKLPNLEVMFSGTGGTIGNIASGSLLFLSLASNGSVSTLTHYARVRFSDM